MMRYSNSNPAAGHHRLLEDKGKSGQQHFRDHFRVDARLEERRASPQILSLEVVLFKGGGHVREGAALAPTAKKAGIQRSTRATHPVQLRPYPVR